MVNYSRATVPLWLVLSVILVGCEPGSPAPTSSSTSGSSPSASGSAIGCAVSTLLAPSCGVLWGIATNPRTTEALATVDEQVGRRFDILYDYHDIVGEFPTPTERQQVQMGRILHLSIAARIYGSAEGAVTYQDIAAGRYDVALQRQATGVAALHTPVFMTFEQEANQHAKLGPRGTAAEFRQAWRHVHDVYVRAGAVNAVWVWVMTGAAENLSRAGELWPGNRFVDWISWNVYNQSGCGSGVVTPDKYVSFEAALTPFYRWVHERGQALGIDPDKPMMISETGSVLYEGDARKTAEWYSQMVDALRRHPQIKAVSLWDSQTSKACDYRFRRDPSVLAAVASVGVNPVVAGSQSPSPLPATTSGTVR